ncbi:toprim domain-containing protein (plasmid) [Lactobacillus sp. ESL0731]|uniref:toprim domain-containing protein n=1 Tax=unclassified Lactobacillus TaxID=2620435 RepID=UPI0023F94CE7|nr:MULTISPECIES: toprim domain-containing protein [unclassified Lactobacillus]WEV52120.1 toprim domain-containing protein [Lactobacillus sp. ESL0700]WEV63247.1 toprim domain-containing protein [Lactobacillus sp. ESL0731]
MAKKEFNGWLNQLYHTNIVDLCNQLGIELTQDGRTYRGKEHDSLVITPNKNSFYWNSRQVGGTGGLMFLKKYYLADDQLSKKELYAKLHKIASENSLIEFDESEQTAEPTVPYVYPQENIVDNINQAKNYLSDERKIAPQFVDWLHDHGYLDQDKMDNAIFKEINPLTGEIIGATKQGTHIDFDKYPKRGTFKEIDKNSTHNAAWFFDIGKPENLRFFESPIDAMSFYQLAPGKLKNTRFVSMNGLKERVASTYMTLTDSQLAKENSGIKSIAFGVDNDEAGDNFIKTMQQYRFTNNQGDNVKLLSAQPNKKWGKDWNDELKGITDLKEKQQEKVVTKSTSATTKVPYEDETGRVTDEASKEKKFYLINEDGRYMTHAKSFDFSDRAPGPVSNNTVKRLLAGAKSSATLEFSIEDIKRHQTFNQLPQHYQKILVTPESTQQLKDMVNEKQVNLENKHKLEKNFPISSDVTKTSITDLMQDVQSYLVDPEKTLQLADFLSNFHDYSIRNRLLIAHQREGALAVASYKKYQEMGYSVKRGEKGIKILVPVQLKKFSRNGKEIPLKYATKEEKAKIKAGSISTHTSLGFVHGNVFDVTQTTMPKEKYPEMYPNRHLDFDISKATDQQKLNDNLDKFANNIGFKVIRNLPDAEYSRNFGISKGVTLPKQKIIYLNPSDTPTEKVTTLMHELGHAQLHDEKSQASRPIKELQAQLTSYLVAKSYGIDNHDYTVDYIASWTDHGKKLNTLDEKSQAAILNNVTKAADKMISSIDGRDKSLTTSMTMKQTPQRKVRQSTTTQQTVNQNMLAAQFAQQQQVQQRGLELG